MYAGNNKRLAGRHSKHSVTQRSGEGAVRPEAKAGFEELGELRHSLAPIAITVCCIMMLSTQTNPGTNVCAVQLSSALLTAAGGSTIL